MTDKREWEMEKGISKDYWVTVNGLNQRLIQPKSAHCTHLLHMIADSFASSDHTYSTPKHM